MIVACLLSIIIQGEFEEHIVTGEVLKVYEDGYIVDLSNSVSGFNGSGDYSHFAVPKERCSVRMKK